MGWKASCILINERGPGYLGTMPTHDPERARRLIADLGLGPCRSRGMTTFDYGIYPDHLVVGAYDGAAVIGTPDLINSSEPIGRNPLILRVLTTFPKAAVLSVCLHSVVNLFNYAYFEEGRLLRAYGVPPKRGSWWTKANGSPKSSLTSSVRLSGTASASSTQTSAGEWQSSAPKPTGRRSPSR
jgi:hypothetical protein